MRMEFLSVVLSGILAPVHAVPSRTVAAPVIRFEGRARPGGLTGLRFSLTNNSRSPVWVIGYLPSPSEKQDLITINPLYRVEFHRDKKWESHFLGWCGTGSGMVSLPPGAKRSFTIQVPPGKWDKVRIGLSWVATQEDTAKPQIAWSEPVPQTALNELAKPKRMSN